MSQRPRDIRNIVIGLFIGVVVTLAMGQAAAPDRRQNAAQLAPRYQIAITRDKLENEYLYILDHQTQKVYKRFVGNMTDSRLVEDMIRNP